MALDTANGWVRLKLNASPPGVKPVGGEIASKRGGLVPLIRPQPEGDGFGD